LDKPPDLKMRLFHAWFLLSRPMTLGVRALAFDPGGRVLLVRHTYVPGWHLPGGGVETGDTVTETLAKELREEANVELGAPPRLMSVHFNNRVTRRDHVVVYRCDHVAQSAPKTRDLEIIEAEFFPADALPDGTTRSSVRRIREGIEGLPPDPYW
jgi:ADP-ribose pyrophosphatase YjhB (NUDIX family)